MYNAFRNSKRNRDRDTNAELTREQLVFKRPSCRGGVGQTGARLRHGVWRMCADTAGSDWE